MHADAEAFVGVLPKPRKQLRGFAYYIEATSKDLGTTRTAEFATVVQRVRGRARISRLAAPLSGAPRCCSKCPAGPRAFRRVSRPQE